VLLLAALACGALAALAIGLWALLASGDDGLAPSTSTSKQQAEASTGQPADLQRTPAAEAPRSAESRRRALGLDLPMNQAAAADNTAPSTEPSPPQADTSLSVIAAEATQPLPTVEAPAPPVPLAQPLDIWAAPAPESADHELASAPVAASTQGAQNAAGDAPAATRASPPASSRTASKPVPVNVRLQVLPWGEVFVDGQRVGISPPLKQLSLSPGRHRIELRNGDFAPHVREIEVSAGTPIDVEHRFAPRP
jgi:non-specific serine/threonine protein kinase